MNRFLSALMISVFALVVLSPQVGAESLKIAPLKYEATLKKAETKKGYVDVSNPEYVPVDVKLSVQAFRQIDNDGSLQFYDNTQVSSGVTLDLASFTLKPRTAMRVYFLLDGSKLPTGDIFAAIFASTQPAISSGAVQSVRVGTLLFLTNGTPTSHQADITAIGASLFQIGDGLNATISVHNPGDEKSYTGFFPELTVKAQPYSTRTVQGPLVFAGRTRTVDYVQNGDYFGPIRILADTGNESSAKWVFAVTGYWRWLAPLLIALSAGLVVLFYKRPLDFSSRQKKSQ